MDESVQVGARVMASDGEIGTVEEVVTDLSTGVTRSIVVRTIDGERLEIPFENVDASDASSSATEVQLLTTRAELIGITVQEASVTEVQIDQAAVADVSLDDVGDQLVVPVREEVLVSTTHPIELGEVLIHKRVETVPYETIVDVTRDDIDIQRVTINRAVDAVPGPRQEGQTLVIPVVEEVLVTEKRLMLREEIRVTRRQVAEQVPIRETLRREVIEIEDPDGGVTRAGGSSNRPRS